MDLESATLISALAEPRRAARAWDAMTRDVPFDTLPNLTIRAMPRIYLNLAGEPDVRHLSLLKGVYRASWSANALRFAAARAFLLALDDDSIDYRVIKGGALCALAGNWAARRMGDLDVVVQPSQAAAARRTLRDLGYVPRAGANDTELGVWDSPQGSVIDLHTTDGRLAPFRDMLMEPGVRATIANTEITIPSREFVFALAVWHAQSATASTDRIQTLIDLATVCDAVDPSRARSIVASAGLLDTADELLSRLSQLGLIADQAAAPFRWRSFRDRAAKSRVRGATMLRLARRALSTPSIAAHRKLTAVERTALRRDDVRLLYRIWANLGQLRPVEVLACDRLNGLLGSGGQPGPIPTRDHRIRIPAEPGRPGRLRIEVTMAPTGGLTASRALFINGRLHGFVPLADGGIGVYDVTPTQDFAEISLRTFSSSLDAPVETCIVSWCD